MHTVEEYIFFPHVSKFRVYTSFEKLRLFEKENDELHSRNYKYFKIEIAAFMSSLSVAVLNICSALGVQFLFLVGLHRPYLHSISITMLQLGGVESGNLCVLLVDILCP